MLTGELFIRIFKFVSLLFSFAFISLINALMIRVTIKSSVIVAFWYFKMEDQCVRRGRRDYNARAYIYRSLGNTGAQAAYLDRHRLSKGGLMVGLSSSLIIYYGMFISCNKMWTMLCFNNTYSGMVNEEYFFYVNYMELVTFLFIRTRSSIKYFPKLITIFNLTFLMYINAHMYAPQQEALLILNNVSILTFLYFIIKYEIDAVQKWNPFGSYTPSIHNPRCAYHHVSQGTEWSIGFDLISMFHPLRFQETFPMQS